MSHSENSPRRSNRLINETSPYLLQHAENPVDWFPWGEEAFERARELDRPIFLSVGYSACHWCHVMERESFENEEIAQILNENYISIKVDREERPDVDQIYMTAVQLITQRGGWPMSVFMTADGKPFYGGTYWPPTSRMGMPGFRDILNKLSDFWVHKRDEVSTSAEQLVAAIQELSAPVFESGELGVETLRTAVSKLLKSSDPTHGGFGGAPKFPHPMDLRLLLRGYARFDDRECLNVATLALDKMLNGGIYDQLGGGFHRYSTDARWLVPHFEKMLYDNALLTPAYLEAWQVTGNDEYARIVGETLDYISREMTSSEGAFYSTQDADSEGEEGKFFVWTESEIRQALEEPHATWFCSAYDVTEQGNWEDSNILNRPRPLREIADRLEISPEELSQSLNRSKQILLKLRGNRVAPGTDEKILVSWNGMMIAAMSQAAFAFNDETKLAAAAKAADFVLSLMRDQNGELLHCFKDGRPRFRAYLDDYACLIDGLVELFQANGDERYLTEALSLAETMIQRFHDKQRGGFFYTADNHESLITRTKEIQDNAVPSGNGMAATALLKLSALSSRSDLAQMAIKTLDAFGEFLEGRAVAAGQALIALDLLLGPRHEIVVVANESDIFDESVLQKIRSSFLPTSLVIHQTSRLSGSVVGEIVSGKTPHQSATRVFICQQGSCREPAETQEQVREQLTAIKQS